MAIEIIDLGTVPLDGSDGDVVREAFEKVNANFAEHESEIDALVPRVATIENEVGQLEIQAGQIQGNLTNLTESFNILSSEVGSNTADIQNLENSREYNLVPGDGITIDRTNPTAPVISSSGSSGSVWGQITGDIFNQTDLSQVLQDKANTTDLETVGGKVDSILSDSSVDSGAGIIPYNSTYQYPTGSVGAALKSIPIISGPDGASKIGTKLSYATSVARTQQAVNDQSVYLEDFGNTSVSDVTSIIQRAVDSGERLIHVRAGRSYQFENVVINNDDVCLILEHGSILKAMSPTSRAFTINGKRVTITGGGTVQGMPVFDGSNVRPQYALFWIVGSDFTADSIVVDTIPKEGFMFEDATGGRILNCRINGRYPYSQYNESSTTNHCAILSNIPPTTISEEPRLIVQGNYIEQCIQGILSLNYGGAGNNTGNLITSNSFKHCWDHGIYMSRGKAHTIVGNNFLSCRRPIVSDGTGATVVGNTLYSELVGTSNNEQMISVRESSNSVIANNTLYGVDASIYVDNIETPDCVGNQIINNNITSTGTAYASCMIRVGVGSTKCEQNTVSGNKVASSSLAATSPLIEVTIAGGFGRGNVVKNNQVVRGNPGHGISVNRNNYATISGNRVDTFGNSSTVVAAIGLRVTNSTFPKIEGNDLYYTEGGTNVDASGIVCSQGNAIPKVKGNTICYTSTFSSLSQISATELTDMSGNCINPNFQMRGIVSWPSGTSSTFILNGNVTSSSRITIVPRNSGAGTIVAAPGYYVIAGTGGFTIYTTNGTNTTTESSWTYVID